MVVLAHFRPFSSGFRSYYGEMRIDVTGFLDLFKGFQDEIGKKYCRSGQI